MAATYKRLTGLTFAVPDWKNGGWKMAVLSALIEKLTQLIAAWTGPRPAAKSQLSLSFSDAE